MQSHRSDNGQRVQNDALRRQLEMAKYVDGWPVGCHGSRKRLAAAGFAAKERRHTMSWFFFMMFFVALAWLSGQEG